MAETAIKERKKGGRPKAKDAATAGPVPFFDRCAQIAPEDWGARAWIKVYRNEPVVNLLLVQDRKFARIYEHLVSEDEIKHDLGSGKYTLYLNFKEPTGNQKQIDTCVLDIFDINFPPVIPPGTWVDHPKNKNWEWAKAKMPAAPVPPAAPTPVSEMAQMLDVLNNVQDSAVERAKANTPTPEKQPDLLATATGLITAISNIMPKPSPQTENAVLQTVVALFTKQIDAAQLQTNQLYSEIRDMRQQQLAKPSGASTIKEIVTEIKSVLPDLKEFFPEAPRRGGPWYTGVLERLAEGASQLIPTVGAQIFSNWAAKQQNGAPALPPGAPPNVVPINTGNGAPRGAAAPIIDLDQMLLSVLNNDGNGEDLAYGLNTFFGQPGQLAYRQACQAGEAALLELLKARPVWNQLGPLQAKMPQFVREFIDWDKPEDEKPHPQSAETLEPLEPEVIS